MIGRIKNKYVRRGLLALVFIPLLLVGAACGAVAGVAQMGSEFTAGVKGVW